MPNTCQILWAEIKEFGANGICQDSVDSHARLLYQVHIAAAKTSNNLIMWTSALEKCLLKPRLCMQATQLNKEN